MIKMISLILCLMLLSANLPGQNSIYRFFMKRTDGTLIELRPGNGLFVDISTGSVRTLSNAGLRGTVGNIWGINRTGDGQSMPLRGARIVYENNNPVIVIDPAPAPLKIKSNVLCVPNANGTAWTIPTTAFEGTITDIVVYRNGLRQNRVTGGYLVDYSVSTDFRTITPNTAFPWTLVRTDGPVQLPDLIIADVFYY